MRTVEVIGILMSAYLHFIEQKDTRIRYFQTIDTKKSFFSLLFAIQYGEEKFCARPTSGLLFWKNSNFVLFRLNSCKSQIFCKLVKGGAYGAFVNSCLVLFCCDRRVS
jgi:hypothetical protein